MFTVVVNLCHVYHGPALAFISNLNIITRELCQYEDPKSANGGGQVVEECRLCWDDKLPIGLETNWKNITRELVMPEPVQFPRGTKDVFISRRLIINFLSEYSSCVT